MLRAFLSQIFCRPRKSARYMWTHECQRCGFMIQTILRLRRQRCPYCKVKTSVRRTDLSEGAK